MDNITIYVPISVGELFDKITILKIKKERITDQQKILNVCKELSLLEESALKINNINIQQLIEILKDINLTLWIIEEKKRQKEKEKCFDDEFVRLAREVYLNNDKRAEIKKQINLLTKSAIFEEKSYD